MKFNNSLIKIIGFVVAASILQYVMEEYISSMYYTSYGIITGIGMFLIMIYVMYRYLLC